MAMCVSVCFVAYIALSLVLYLGELTLNGMFVYQTLADTQYQDWFVPLIGLLLLPMVIVQLVSAVLLLLKKGDKLNSCNSMLIAALHIFQLGFIWRHVTLFREKDPVLRSQDLGDLSVLQVLHTFSSMLPLLTIQVYILLQYDSFDWLTLATIFVTLLTIGWFLASFRRHHVNEDLNTIVMAWPGTLFRLLWRLGEITSRVISLAVFASAYFYWTFLIFGLHWLTMMVCVCTSIMETFSDKTSGRGYRFFMGLIISYMYSFCFVNFSSHNTTFRYVLYYVIMFAENAILTVVWYLHSNQSELDSGTRINTIVFISVSSFFIGIISLLIYYRFFHIRVTGADGVDKEHTCVSNSCINCRLSLCSKHSLKLQRPFSAGWISQYQQALANGNYYKVMQDSFVDSMSDWDNVSSALSSSEASDGSHHQNHSLHQHPHTHSNSDSGKQYNTFQANGTYSHKRFFDSKQDLLVDSDSDSIASIMDAGGDQWYSTAGNYHELSNFSEGTPHSVCSSRTHLLTDSWDSLLQDKGNPNQAMKLDLVSSLIRKDIDSGLFSDGYSTDHTLDSYQLPVTVLAKKRQRYHRRSHPSPPSTYSTGSDSTDCTICAFMRHNHSHSPVSSMRSSRVNGIIPEETPNEVKGHQLEIKQVSVVKKKRQSRSGSGYDEKRIVVKVDRNGKRRAYNDPTYAVVDKSRKSKRVNDSSTKTSEKELSVHTKSHRSRGNTSLNLTYGSDSGDSAFPRSTPLSSYLAATDDDEDGASETGIEMII